MSWAEDEGLDCWLGEEEWEREERLEAKAKDHDKRCGAPLKKRVNRNTGEPFMGCSTYPLCRYTREWDPEDDLPGEG